MNREEILEDLEISYDDNLRKLITAVKNEEWFNAKFYAGKVEAYLYTLSIVALKAEKKL